MTSTHTLICLAAGAGIAIAGAHVRQAIETATTHTEAPMQYHHAEVIRPLVAAPQPKALTLDDLFAAIAQVETGGEADPDHAIGDGGRSRGRYQIGFDYWRDAWRAEDLPSEYARYCRHAESGEMSRETMRRYWWRWAPNALAAGDFRTLAMTHNAGPSVVRLLDTAPENWTDIERNRMANAEAYWQKVNAIL